jgi:dihydroorotate dehydrogenase (NAD+) catalytic subunit
MVRQVVKTVNIPVIGMGGIMEPGDALEFLIAGAQAVQVGTANFTDPRVSLSILEGIERFLKERNLNSVRDIIGSLKS